jgi:PIN domain nuclease of toxin-antitoxin system
VLPAPLESWIELALSYPGVRLLNLSPGIAIESTRLPGAFHRDPADQIIVATARSLDCVLLAVDELILAYPYVRTLSPREEA